MLWDEPLLDDEEAVALERGGVDYERGRVLSGS
jgi:hypothetical protein